MSFTLQTWQAQAGKQLRGIGGWLERARHQAAPNLVYGALCGLSLWPLVEAAQQGQTLPVMMALGNIAAGVGGNLLAEQVQRWRDRADQETVAQWAAETAPTNPQLREALDQILEKLDAIPQAQAVRGESDRQWFTQTLRQELASLGNLPRFEAQLSGSGAIAQGQGRAVGQGGVLVEGDVQGDVITGSKTTVFDQRGQKVKRQFNIGGDWKGSANPDSTDDEDV
jgi:hypothetical protein